MNPTTPQRRGGRKPSPHLSRPDLPWTIRLPDGRTVLVEVPGRWVTQDVDGSILFEPEAVDFLERIRALSMSALDRPPSPGYITRLREGLGMTQEQFGARIGVDKLSVSRWERGTVRPSAKAVHAIEKVRRQALRRGVAIAS